MKLRWHNTAWQNVISCILWHLTAPASEYILNHQALSVGCFTEADWASQPAVSFSLSPSWPCADCPLVCLQPKHEAGAHAGSHATLWCPPCPLLSGLCLSLMPVPPVWLQRLWLGISSGHETGAVTLLHDEEWCCEERHVMICGDVKLKNLQLPLQSFTWIDSNVTFLFN